MPFCPIAFVGNMCLFIRVPNFASLLLSIHERRLTQMLRLHGLYPIPGPQMAELAPDVKIGHLHIVEKRNEKCLKEDWVCLRSCIERSKITKFGTLTKRHVLPTKAMGQNGKMLSLLELYLTLYTVYLSEARLSITKEN